MSFELPKDLGQLMQKAQEMQAEWQKMQEDLANKVVEGSAGGGMVKVVMNGKRQLVSIAIEKEIVDPDDIEMLQDLVVAAVNQATQKASELAQSQLGQAAAGLNIPLPDLG